jgi:hypothetical protein
MLDLLVTPDRGKLPLWVIILTLKILDCQGIRLKIRIVSLLRIEVGVVLAFAAAMARRSGLG